MSLFDVPEEVLNTRPQGAQDFAAADRQALISFLKTL
jgi:hypothetical protein